MGGFKSLRRGQDTEMWARMALEHPIAVSTAQTTAYVRGVGGIVETMEARGETRPVPASLRDLSPYCAVAASALEAGGTAAAPAPSLRAYLNAAVTRAIRQLVVRGEVAKAREHRRLYIDGMRTTDRVIAFYIGMPDAAVTATTGVWRRARRRMEGGPRPARQA